MDDMATVQFEVVHEFEASAQEVWDALVDWKGHESWIPLTKVEIDGDDPTAVGATFTATTGIGPLAMPDRMEVERCQWNDAEATGDCVVRKLGPVLTGTAGFTVEPATSGSVVRWFEDVEVRWAPGFASPVLTWIGSRGFSMGMGKLAKQLAAAPATSLGR